MQLIRKIRKQKLSGTFARWTFDGRTKWDHFSGKCRDIKPCTHGRRQRGEGRGAVPLLEFHTWYWLIRASAEKFPGWGRREKQNRKIPPLNFPLLYQYHVWKSKGATARCLLLPTLMGRSEYLPYYCIAAECRPCRVRWLIYTLHVFNSLSKNCLH